MIWLGTFLLCFHLSSRTLAQPTQLPFPIPDTSKSRGSDEIPSYVLDHAPIIHFDTEEQHFPIDPLEFIKRVRPYKDGELVPDAPEGLGPSSIADLRWNDEKVYLTTSEDVTRGELPTWLRAAEFKPRKSDGRSKAPVTVILVDKTALLGSSVPVIDAIYLYFYAWNEGLAFGAPLGTLGRHVGDWEHSIIRFVGGKPERAFLSVHGAGAAHPWSDLLFSASHPSRPLFFVARGTHALYSRPGRHDFAPPPLPRALLVDETSDQGPIWDTALHVRAWWFGFNGDGNPSFVKAPRTGSKEDVEDAGEWLWFLGRWGNKAPGEAEKGQREFLGWRTFVDGPQGPLFKDLTREKLESKPTMDRWKAGKTYLAAMSKFFQLVRKRQKQVLSSSGTSSTAEPKRTIGATGLDTPFWTEERMIHMAEDVKQRNAEAQARGDVDERNADQKDDDALIGRLLAWVKEPKKDENDPDAVPDAVAEASVTAHQRDEL